MFTKISHKSIQKLEKLCREGTLKTATEIMLVLTISRFGWGKDGNRNPCKKSIKSMAELLGCSESSVKRALRKLRDVKLVGFQYRTRSMGDNERTTSSWDKAQAQLKRGSKQLRSFYYLKEKGITTAVQIHRTDQHTRT